MKLISYDSKVYITDGHSKRYIGSPAVMADLLKITGQTQSIGVSKATIDFLEDHVTGSSLLLATNNVGAMVETNRRIILDLHT